jgi:hypothetical protein
MAADKPSLAAFERQVARRELEPASITALSILRAIDGKYGRLDGVELGEPAPHLSQEDIAKEFCTRFAAAYGTLVSDPGFQMTPVGFESVMSVHRWVDLIFAISGFRTTDHLLPLVADPGEGQGFRFNADNAARLFTVLSTNSRYGIDFEQCWRARPAVAATAFLQYISSRYVFRPRAFDFRERLLEWLPPHLDKVKLGLTALSGIAEIYMHCSYAMTPKKHDIKASIMRQMRRACLNAGCPEMTVAPALKPGEMPVAIVTAEHFTDGHAVHRTHSLAARSLRERFRLVGIIHPKSPGPPVEDYFDEIIPIPPGAFFQSVKGLAQEILKREPAVVFHLGVGMVSKIIALASLRLAPVQCVSFGHTASTMSPVMDHYILPEDFVASRDVFSENVLALPIGAFPFVPPRVRQSASRRAPASDGDGILRVAVPASTMKLNPRVFRTLAAISEQAKHKIEYQFYPLASRGLAHIHLANVVAGVLPDAVVFPEAPYDVYLNRLAACDLFLCPFPYGNMNSIIDAVSLGLPGVCLDGPEAHSHADAAMFARMNFPAELTAQDASQYVASAVRLIDDADWRRRCREIATNADLDAAFFKGDPGLFCDAIAELVWADRKTASGARKPVAATAG